MRAYVCIYNVETKRVETIFSEIDSEFDAKHVLQSNIYEENSIYTTDAELQEAKVQKLNEQLQSGEIRIDQCQDCGMYFYILPSESEYYSNRHMSLKYCISCRVKPVNRQE